MSHPLVEQLLDGTGLLYAVLAILAVMALLVRGLSDDPNIRRRAILAAAFLLIVALLRVWLSFIPEQTSGFIVPPGQTLPTPGAVPNPLYQYVSVAYLMAALLAALLTASLFLVDYLLVGKLDFEIPAILRDVTILVLFFAGALFILSSRTGMDPTGIFTTAGVVSIVIGLALQDTLGNVFSGLALQTERSFNVGDWVRFGDREGVVTDISWRATKLRTRQNDLVIIPNSVISKDIVINYSAPTRIHAILAHVGCHYRHPPADVIAAVEEAADQTVAVLKRPRVDVRTKEFGDHAITYEVKYWIRDYEDLEDISNAFMTRVWYAFARRGIEIPFPIRNVYLHEVTPETIRASEKADDERIFEHLRRVEVFDALSEEEARSLAARAKAFEYFTGETIVRQGQPGDSMFIIDSGRVEVVVSHNGRSQRLAELGPNQFMGEMALMTGADRTATVVALEPTHCFVIDRDAFRDTLERNPRIAERISATLALRQRELEATQEALHRASVRGPEDDRRQILTRIWDFFGFRETEDA